MPRGGLAHAFTIVEEEEGPWHEEGYAYHLLLAVARPGQPQA